MRSRTFAALISKWCWQVLPANPAIRRRATGQSPEILKTCSVEYIGPCLLSKIKSWKEIPCVENLQITYCVICRNTNIRDYCCQRSVFCDCYRNMGHFLCSVERIKRFVNVHLHCIISNIPSECTNAQDHQNCCAVKSHSRVLATFQNNGKAGKQ